MEEEHGGKLERRRDKKWTLKLSKTRTGKKDVTNDENRLRKRPQRFAIQQEYSEDSKGTTVNVLGLVKKESNSPDSLATLKQVFFEQKILELLAKCREYCPKIYSKLEKMSQKSRSKNICSRTNFGLSETGMFRTPNYLLIFHP